MEVGKGIHVVPEGMVDMQGDVRECERAFQVGELVEFWSGTVVRAYQTDSGEPAYVKAIQGSGWYGIKWWEALGGGTDEFFGRICLKIVRLLRKL